MEQTLLQCNAMQLGVFQLLEARRELLDVQLAYADTMREYWSAQAEYEVLLSGRMVTAVTASWPHLDHEPLRQLDAASHQ